ncbi:MAG: hypothetical protein DI537_35910 [Stutzerimonas stutzeri]|nr:MAG: hypothetical protein DI537_35910 [Stutzerimonas stutzeri]
MHVTSVGVVQRKRAARAIVQSARGATQQMGIECGADTRKAAGQGAERPYVARGKMGEQGTCPVTLGNI